jgi:hypothetical protein
MANPDLVMIKLTQAKTKLVIGLTPKPSVQLEIAKVMKGDPGVTPDANSMEGFTTDPLAYYILASQ